MFFSFRFFFQDELRQEMQHVKQKYQEEARKVRS